MNDVDFVTSFKDGQIDPKTFTHQDHLRVAFCLLKNMPFLEACIAMREGLKMAATKVGRSNLYHETITVAFMAIVLERIYRDQKLDWRIFLDQNKDLCDRALLSRYYSSSTLESQMARTQFVLDDRQCQAKKLSAVD